MLAGSKTRKDQSFGVCQREERSGIWRPISGPFSMGCLSARLSLETRSA